MGMKPDTDPPIVLMINATTAPPATAAAQGYGLGQRLAAEVSKSCQECPARLPAPWRFQRRASRRFAVQSRARLQDQRSFDLSHHLDRTAKPKWQSHQ